MRQAVGSPESVEARCAKIKARTYAEEDMKFEELSIISESEMEERVRTKMERVPHELVVSPRL